MIRSWNKKIKREKENCEGRERGVRGTDPLLFVEERERGRARLPIKMGLITAGLSVYANYVRCYELYVFIFPAPSRDIPDQFTINIFL